MELIDNVNKTLKDDLTVSIQKDSKISIAAACFSIYAFQELKRELKNVDELRFIFTSPTFIKEKAKKEKREFYIPRQTRERSLYGSEFEVKLRNEMTQRAIAKECAEWIRKKATFKSNVTSENMMGFMNVDSNSYMPLNGFTTIDLGCERGNNAYYPIQKTDTPMSQFYLDLFEQIWNDEARLQEVTDEVVDSITTVYSENSPDYIYFVTLYNIFNEFLEDVSEDVLPNEATGFKDSKIWNLLYNFQKDAVLAIINKLEKYNGCILADSVGLGKTFTSLAVIKYYENRNKSVLVLCPKKLANNWNTYKDNYVNNPIAADRMRYDVLFHTDLSREDGTSNGLDLDRLNWGNYDLVVIDESHNFRNGGRVSQDGDKENRYLKLLNKVIRKGVKTKVLMLSATPVNNRFVDLKNQLALAYEGESSILDGKLNTSRSIEDIFKQAQAAFNAWSKYEPQDRKRTPSVLFSHLAVKNPVSLNEWKKHQSINAWTISPKRILFSAQCEHPAIEATILAFCNQIDEELRNGTVILSNLSDDGMGINMETYKIPLPPQVDRRKIQAKKDIISGKPIYRYHDTKFSLSKKQIIDLLMGTKLYGKPEVALRELLQNSIDACLLRQKLSELWGIEYTPKVKVSLYTKNNVDYLQVSDNGVGMNQHIIDNYYTNIGCSYYSSREFSDLMVSFKSSFTPISRFGIGILSCFMVCDSMEVTTRRIRERFECDEALHVSIEGYESLFVISDSDKKDPGTDTILTLRPVHPWDRMDEDEFVQCIKGIVPNPAVQIEIETDKRSESYSSDYFDDLDLSPLLDYSWNNTKNIRKIDIDLTCEEYGFKGRGCIGILIKNDMPVEEIEILSKDVEIDGEIYTLSSSVKYKNNCITETSTSISVDEDGEIDTNTSWSERFKSKSSLSIHGIEVPYNLFPNYSNKMSKAVLNILFPFSFRLDIGVNSDLNLNSARDQIIYDEKWLTFEENLYQVICKRLKEQLSLSDWERLNEIIQKNGKNIFSRVANNIE